MNLHISNDNKLDEENSFDIAIIGMAGRFPGAENIDQYWQNLCSGEESITFFSDEELEEAGVDPEVLKEANYIKASPILSDPSLFDAKFFGYSPKEAGYMDPQHRLFLECAYEALEYAGYDPEIYDGSIGVFGGASMNTYLIFSGLYSKILTEQLPILIGNDKDFLTTRVSYKLNLKGPSFTVQAACSTSLVAIHIACQSLLNNECDMALSGGVSVRLPHKAGYFYQEGNIYSPDGHCRAFDAKAQGTTFGSGVGIVVLKRLVDAVADGDFIHAVIKGSAINNDGSSKVDYTAPSVDSQSAAVVEAIANSAVEADSITYIETHGTGTSLGDPIEIAALTNAFRTFTDKNGFCAVGSVKTNIGHLDAAAGVASLIKTVLALKYKQIPPSLHFEKPNPEIDFENSPFYVNKDLSEWESNHYPRRTGVNSLGVGGTNVHVILEEAPDFKTSDNIENWHLLLLSAKSNTALDSATINLAKHLKQNPKLNLSDVAYTLQIGRKAFNHRSFAVCKDLKDAVEIFESFDSNRIVSSHQSSIDRDVVFIFSGQGSQYVNMGLELYNTESVFQEQIDRCSEILKGVLSFDLRDVMFPDEKNIEKSADLLKQTYITQPALFVFEYAIAKLWASWGVHPTAFVGHSIGEYVAACLAEVFSLEDALALVAARGRLMWALPEGSMLAVFLSENDIQSMLNQDLSLAAINAASLCVVSGDNETIDKLAKKLSAKNKQYRRLHTSHAFHSKMMDPILEEFTEQVRKVSMHPPIIPFVSNVTGTWITPEEAVNPAYWAKHLRQTVRFADCINELLKEANSVLLEVGPGNTFSTLASQHPSRKKEHIILSTTRHPKDMKPDVAFILETLGRLWLSGVKVNWSQFYAAEERQRLPLPTYPFQRKRFWIESESHAFTNASKLPKLLLESTDEDLTDKAPTKLKSGNADNDTGNSVEQTIVNIWQKLLGYEKISINDNFFELGGNSLMAASMFSQMEKIFGKRIPLSTLFEAPTVKQLSSILSSEEWKAAWSPLVTIQSTGSQPPFFCIHPHRGNVLNFYELANHLGPDRPFYALQARGLDGEKVEIRSLSEMAAEYLEEIRTIQPKGPYFLGGYCMGADIAFQMAQLIRAEGEDVALLALIQPNHPEYLKFLPNVTSFHRHLYRVLDKVEFELSNIRVLRTKGKLAYIWRKTGMLMAHMQVATEKTIESLLSRFHLSIPHSLAYKLQDLYDLHLKAYENLKLFSYSGRAAIFRASMQPHGINPDPTLGWGPLMEGELKLIEIPGHYLDMFVEPSIQILAEKLKVYLNKGQIEPTPADERNRTGTIH